MMWDLGGGNYVSGTAEPIPQPAYRRSSVDATYALSSLYPAPYAPIGGPPPHFPSPGPYIQTHSYSETYSYPVMPGAEIARSAVVAEVHHTHHHRHSRPHAHRQDSRPRSIAQPRAPQTTQKSAEHWECSNCTGRKKALCIGINYLGSSAQLRGCINDAKNVRKFLIRHWGYKAEQIVLLTDDATDSRLMPTRQNILNAMHWLISGAHKHDALFFHFSGHGSQVKDTDGDEKDGYDEVIFPVDYKKTGVIVDDEMSILMVKPLPVGCRLTALFDSCHSGSVLDLPYLYHSNGREKGSQVTASHVQEKSTLADVITWSGCKDSQTSADTYEGGVAVGAMSYAFMKCLREKPEQSYQDLLRGVRGILREKYKQKPQLSSSHRIDTARRFIM